LKTEQSSKFNTPYQFSEEKAPLKKM